MPSLKFSKFYVCWTVLVIVFCTDNDENLDKRAKLVSEIQVNGDKTKTFCEKKTRPAIKHISCPVIEKFVGVHCETPKSFVSDSDDGAITFVAKHFSESVDVRTTDYDSTNVEVGDDEYLEDNVFESDCDSMKNETHQASNGYAKMLGAKKRKAECLQKQNPYCGRFFPDLDDISTKLNNRLQLYNTRVCEFKTAKGKSIVWNDTENSKAFMANEVISPKEEERKRKRRLTA